MNLTRNLDIIKDIITDAERRKLTYKYFKSQCLQEFDNAWNTKTHKDFVYYVLDSLSHNKLKSYLAKLIPIEKYKFKPYHYVEICIELMTNGHVNLEKRTIEEKERRKYVNPVGCIPYELIRHIISYIVPVNGLREFMDKYGVVSEAFYRAVVTEVAQSRNVLSINNIFRVPRLAAVNMANCKIAGFGDMSFFGHNLRTVVFSPPPTCRKIFFPHYFSATIMTIFFSDAPNQQLFDYLPTCVTNFTLRHKDPRIKLPAMPTISHMLERFATDCIIPETITRTRKLVVYGKAMFKYYEIHRNSLNFQCFKCVENITLYHEATLIIPLFLVNNRKIKYMPTPNEDIDCYKKFINL